MGESLDMQNERREKAVTALAAAMQSGDRDAMTAAMADFSKAVEDRIIAAAASVRAEEMNDAAVLASRGARVLTSAENKYYTKVIAAMQENDPKMALTNIEIAMPETVIDRVFEDIRQAHPLLDAIGFINTNGAVKMIVNKGEAQLAVWGKLTDGYTKELAGSIEETDTKLLSLSAFIPIAKAMLDLGPVWLDSYIRTILSEAIANGVEDGILNGDGDGKPVGMNRVVGKNAVVTGGKYSEKTAEKLTSLDSAAYGAFISGLATNSETGNPREVSQVVMIVNPVDYLKVVGPATTMLTPSGTYVNNVFPVVPTKVIQSRYMAQGKAIFGLARRYFMALGSPKNGKIEYDDSVKFMSRERVYGIFLYGNGMPLDNNAFKLADISGLKPLRYQVTTLTESLDTAADGGSTKEGT